MSSVTAALGRVVVVEPRPRATLWLGLVVAVVSILAALAAGAVLLAATGANPGDVYRTMIDSTLGSPRDLSRTLNLATPLILCGLAVAVAYRMRLWTIGAEGQLFVGAITGSGMALWLGSGTPGWFLILASLVAAVLGGALWALVAAIPRAYLGTDEVLTTLMLNFVALYLMSFLIYGSLSPWRDKADLGRPHGAPLPEGSELPTMFERGNAGIVVAAAVALLVWVLLARTRLGFQVEILGDSTRAGGYAGVAVPVVIMVVFALSGGLAGLAGGIQVTNETAALEPDTPNQGLGYSGIVVAALARLNPLAVVPVGFLVAVLLGSQTGLSIEGIPPAVVTVLQGLILLFVAAGQFHLAYRVRRPGLTARRPS
jgi:simple sugar transport system permease protein